MGLKACIFFITKSIRVCKGFPKQFAPFTLNICNIPSVHSSFALNLKLSVNINFFLLTGATKKPCYLHSIYITCIIYRLLGFLFVVCSKFFLCRKTGEIWRKIWQKLSSANLVKLAFCNSGLDQEHPWMNNLLGTILFVCFAASVKYLKLSINIVSENFKKKYILIYLSSLCRV